MMIGLQMEPEVRDFIESVARQPFPSELGPEKGRLALEKVQSQPINLLPVDIEDLAIKDGPADQVSIRILRPQISQEVIPVIMYIHGAGWVFGNKHTHDRLVRELAIGARAAVVFPEYSLSPEARYPTAVEETYSVLRWIFEHGLEHGLDPERLAVAGDNVGGNITAAVTLLAKERGGPVILRQLFFYPVIDASFDTESYRQYANGYYLRRDEMIWYWNQYIPNVAERNEITASPLRASNEQLKGLPAALIITAELDVLRDEGEAYADKLRQAGVRVTAVRFQGTIHDFVLLNALANSAATRGAIALATAWLREGFSTSP